jgi:hypothetical protein
LTKLMDESIVETNLRLDIIKWIAVDSKISEIALNLGVAASVIRKKIRMMRYLHDENLKNAEKKAYKLHLSKSNIATSTGSKRFLTMTGLTFQEKNFDNMIDLYRSELLRVLKAKNQYEAIMRLPRSIRSTLCRNKIIIRGGKDQVVSAEARKHLKYSIDLSA